MQIIARFARPDAQMSIWESGWVAITRYLCGTNLALQTTMRIKVMTCRSDIEIFADSALDSPPRLA